MNGLRVLVVDDEESLRDVLTASLRRLGARVRAVPDGEAGIRAVREEEFDAVVCDLMMPGLDGLGVLAALRELRPELGVIIATGAPTAESAATAARLGAFAFITKPFQLAALASLVAAAARKTKGE